MDYSVKSIEAMIYTIRGQRVMLDNDIAKLYEVETKYLNKQVNRNNSRFPEDFMFRLNEDEFEILRCQIGTSSSGHGGRRYMPLVFTECGVAMLSSILTSDRAAQVNISIMRTFMKMRSFLDMESSIKERVDRLEDGTNQLFKVVFERLDSLEDQITPKLPLNRKKIGLNPKEK